MPSHRPVVLALAVVAILFAHTAVAQQKSFSRAVKEGFREGPARQWAPLTAEAAPRLAWAMGWDFQDRQWKLNEFSNQMAHLAIGSFCSRFMGRSVTLGVALTTEVVQFFRSDHMKLKLPDRARDVTFYLLG
jgi:hypothetical protein